MQLMLFMKKAKKMASKPKFNYSTNPMWLTEETGMNLGMSWCLCVTEKAYQIARRQLAKEGKRTRNIFPKGGAQAQFIYSDGELTDCIVCLNERDDPIENAVLLVHEAVHIWQRFCKEIGEKEPSSEFEAYTIQNITHRLFHAYHDALKQRKEK